MGVSECWCIEPELVGSCRFTNRLANAHRTSSQLQQVHDRYDLIFIIHVSNCFGVEAVSPQCLQKIVLFPMFTGDSYVRSGELVPDDYFAKERSALELVPLISSPSLTESRQLQSAYQVHPDRILIHPRGIDLETYCHQERSTPDEQGRINILNIASIKPQKNQMDIVRLVDELKRRRLEPVFHLTGGVGSRPYYVKLKRLITDMGLEENFHLYHTVQPDTLVQIARQCHYAISVSRWETFGKGVFEGLATGLPSFAYSSIECLWEYLQRNGAIKATPSSPSGMADAIEAAIRHPSDY